ncbi:MAG: flagellar export protein FliJ [Solirubrobacteraceae bacterium]|nr:flagellar export protein FliJ [Solirubrobacteraceae bacterium]
MAKQSPFKFRLQPVLEIREKDEDKAKEQLAETIQLRTQGREMLQSAEQLVEEANEAERAAARRAVTVHELAAQQLWRERLERHRLAAGQQLEQAENEVDLSRRALVHAHQRRAALDRLKDIKRDEHRVHLEGLEAAEVDEIALQQHHRRMRGHHA